jgi:protein-serine/threonine kinase
VIETDKFIGIVLEYASGGELFDHILAHRYLRERDASKLFAQLISGVWYCHKKKIVHRDLKLENLLLDRNRNVIITDFGFANHFEKKQDDLMQTSCGSPCYAAPELVISEGMYVGSAVDVWSCGVILYAMLAGYLPFDDDPNNPDGDNINLLYKYIVSTPLTFPDYVSMEARDLLSIMLVPDPKYRATLEQVMAHSWLSAFQPLFRQSVRDLEHAAHAQQQEKRQQYQRQMRERALQQQQQQRAANGQGAGGPTTSPPRTRTTSGYPAAEQFFEDRDAAHAQLQQPLYTASPTRARPVTTSVTLASPAPVVEDTPPTQNTNDFPYIPDYNVPGGGSAHVVIGGPSGTPSADTRTRKESTRSRSGKQKPAVPIASSPGNTGTPSAAASSASPTSPPRTGGPSSPSTEKKRRAAPSQRHTIQLEYGGDATSGTNQSTPRASGERTPVATTHPAASQPPTPQQQQPSPVKPQGGRKATRPDSDGLDTVHYDPFTSEGIPRDLFREPDPAVVEALKRDEEERAAAATATASAAPFTPKSVGRAGGATYRSPSTPTPVSPAVISSKETSAPIGTPSPMSKKSANVSGSSLAPSQQTHTTPPVAVSRTGSTRHRRGVSMDKFGLGKLLGTSDQQQQPGPPSSTASATFAAQHQTSQLAKAPSGGSTSSEHSKPPTTGGSKKSGGTLPSLRTRLSGRLSRRQSGDVASVSSDKSTKEKEDKLHHILQQQHLKQKVEQDGSKKRRNTLSLMIDPMK